MAKNESSLKANYLFNLSYQLLAIILPFVTAPYVTRVLGADRLGVYSYVHTFAKYFLLFAMLGVKNYGNRSIAYARDDKEKLRQTFWEIFAFQFIMAFFVSIAYFLYCSNMIRENRTIYLIDTLFVCSGFFDVDWLCFGLEKFRLTAVRSLIIRTLTVACVFLFVKKPEDLWLYTLIFAVSFVATALAVWPFVVRQVGFMRPTWRGIRQHIVPNLVLFWPVIAVSLYNFMDILMLGRFSAKSEVAFYTYAENLTNMTGTIILSLDNVIMPRMSNLFSRNDKKTIQSLMDRVMLFVMFLSCALSFGLAGVAQTFAPWFYGKEFARCGLFITLLCPTILFKAWAAALRTQYIIPAKKDRIYLTSLTMGAMVNVVINLLLIPKLAGVGAIIGTICAEGTVCVAQFFMCRKEVDARHFILRGIGFAVIGVLMYVPVTWLGGVGNGGLRTLVVQIMSGAAIYLLAAAFYMLKILRDPHLINMGLRMLHIHYEFR